MAVLQVRSAGLNLGTTFTVCLPRLESHTSPSTTTPAANQTPIPPGVKVLIVDDNEANVTGLAMILETWGCEVKTAGDGQPRWPPQTRYNLRY
ncbi:MAG: hypothetical protein R3F37_07140 [Candidatus Competibacteraceae bacterium]